jgi:hypothetical protein
MGKHLQAEPRIEKPTDFDGWASELALFADCEGETAVLGIVMRFAPEECVRALSADQRLWASVIARARYADMKRYEMGVLIGLTQTHE